MEPFTLMLIGSAALGALQGQQSARRRKEDNIYRKAVLTYRPWTGLNDPGASEEKGDMFSGAAQGALTGGFIGKGLGMKGGESWFQPTAAAGASSAVAPEASTGAYTAAANAPTDNLDSELAKIAAAQSQKVSGYPKRSPQSLGVTQNPYMGVPPALLPYPQEDNQRAYQILNSIQQQQYGR
jgi:hypothetical protein